MAKPKKVQCCHCKDFVKRAWQSDTRAASTSVCRASTISKVSRRERGAERPRLSPAEPD